MNFGEALENLKMGKKKLEEKVGMAKECTYI